MRFFKIILVSLAMLGASEAIIVKCGETGGAGDGGKAFTKRIVEGIKYLQNRSALIKSDTTKRISCSYDSGIWVRNKSMYDMAYKTSIFADHADRIVRECANNGLVSLVKGTVYDEIFDVVVGGTDC